MKRHRDQVPRLSLDKVIGQRRALVSPGDLDLLFGIIKHSQIYTLLLNGKTTSKEIFKYFHIKPTTILLQSTDRVEGYFAQTDNIMSVEINRTINLVGWDVYLQRKGKVEVLFEWVEELLKSLNSNV